MKKILSLVLLICASFTFAQNNNNTIVTDSNDTNNSGSLNLQSGFWLKTDTNNPNLEGTFYAYNNWINRAEVYDKNGKGYNIPNCNFNVKFNRVEALLDNESKGKIFAFNTREISKVKLGLKTFVNKSIENKPDYLLEVVQEGKKISLYKSYTYSISSASINPMTQQTIGNDKIVLDNTYYVEKEGKTQEIKLKKSTLLKLMANNKDAVKSFIKENKLSTSNDADLFKIFQYYNTL